MGKKIPHIPGIQLISEVDWHPTADQLILIQAILILPKGESPIG
ncbi:MAG: hypothetical protein ACE5OZ_07035 [Candidatus Heimdallarchaeota archaeon]